MDFTAEETEQAPANLDAFVRWLGVRIGRPPTDIEIGNAKILIAQKRRAAWTKRMYRDSDFPRAIAAIIRNFGAPKTMINGRDAWSIVCAADPDVALYLHGLGKNLGPWKDLQLDVKRCGMKAAAAAKRAMGAGNVEKAHELLRLSGAAQSAAYLAKTTWRKRAHLAAVDLSNTDDMVPDMVEPDDARGGGSPPPVMTP